LCRWPFRKDSVLVFDNGQPLGKLSELLFEKNDLPPKVVPATELVLRAS
jgi:hypothetical protein